MKTWIQSQGGWAHFVTVVLAIGVLQFKTDPQFHSSALALWGSLPALVQDVVFLVFTVGLLYARTQKPNRPTQPAQTPEN